MRERPMNAWVKILVLLVAFVAGFAAGHHVAGLAGTAKVAGMQRDAATATEKATDQARGTERGHADAFAAIDFKFQGDMRYAQALSASTVAGLRDGSIRLRDTWRCPVASSLSAAATSAGGDGTADRLRQESAGRIVQSVAELQAERDKALDKLAAERK